MSLQWATRAGPLRHLRLGAAFSSPTRVIAVQNQLRRVCLAAKHRLASPQVGSLSALISQQSRSLATATATETETETAKPRRGRPPGSGTKDGTKDKPAKKKPVKAKKPKAKKPLTEKQKAMKEKRKRQDQIKELKAIALVPPKKLTASAWPLSVRHLVAETGPGKPAERFGEAISRVKELTPDEYKKFEDQASENRASNAANYEAWVKSYTPNQIKAANIARRALRRILQKRVPLLEDDRQVKRPRTAYFMYMMERQNSNDMKHLRGPKLAHAVGEEWSKMTDYEKEPYLKKQAEDRQRYDREHKEVYGEDAREFRPKEELDSDLV